MLPKAKGTALAVINIYAQPADQQSISTVISNIWSGHSHVAVRYLRYICMELPWLLLSHNPFQCFLILSEALQMCPIQARNLFRFVFVDLWATHRNLISVETILRQATFVKPNENAGCIYSDGTQGIPNNLVNCSSSNLILA